MTTRLPEKYTTRPARLEDLEETVAMFNAHSRWQLGVEQFRVEDIRAEWTMPKNDLSETTRLVLSPDGRIVGYYEFWSVAPHTTAYIWGRVAPEHAGKGIGSFLLDWAVSEAERSVSKAPPETRVAIHAHILSINEPAAVLLSNAGFSPIRYSLRMVIDLDEPPEMPLWPEEITIRSYRLGRDERVTFDAIHDSFRDHWGYEEHPKEEQFQEFLHFQANDENLDPDLWFLAEDGEEIAGISLCRDHLHEDPGLGWVSTLGVRRPWRREGLGKALLLHSFCELYHRGRRRVGLGVDAQSLTGATRLYEKAGMHPVPDRQFTLFEKELRPGVILSTQSISEE